MAVNKLVSDVNTRCRRLLNDDAVAAGRVFTDAVLLPHIQAAYDWFRLNLGERLGVDFRKRVIDLTYTAEEDTLDDLTGWPTDIWMPEIIWFRQNANEAYAPLDKVDALPAIPAASENNRLTLWEWRNRKAMVVPAKLAGQVMLDYLSVLSDLTGPTSPLLMDMSLTAIAYYAAADASLSRGQPNEAARFLGRKETPTEPGYGAAEFVDKVIRTQIKNDQYTPRRGEPEHGRAQGIPASGGLFI